VLAAIIPLGLLKLGQVQTLQSESVLTPQEAQRLRELEAVIQEGFESFLRVGLAFAEVRFHKLHRATHARFEDYCRDRWALSLSRCNQIINTVKVVENITGVFPQDATLLAETNESSLRPLSRLEPELQTAAWELIRHIEERPHGKTIQEVVSTIRSAIATGWQERAPSKGRNGTTPHRPLHRRSDDLGCFSRWSRRIDSWDPQANALGDNETCLRRHLKAARQLRAFCEGLIKAIENRLRLRPGNIAPNARNPGPGKSYP
jgi:hypothetical protein